MMSESLPSDLVDLFSELTAEDHERHEPPSEIWAGIEAAVDADNRREADTAVASVTWLRHRGPVVLAVAATLVLVAAVAALLISDDSDKGEIVATTTITDEGLSVTGTPAAEARLYVVDDHFELEVAVGDLPDADGFYEVWLINTDVTGMFSLGTVSGEARLRVPDGVDPIEYPVVDISIEPIDGDPTHSGQSVLRGVLA